MSAATSSNNRVGGKTRLVSIERSVSFRCLLCNILLRGSDKEEARCRRRRRRFHPRRRPPPPSPHPCLESSSNVDVHRRHPRRRSPTSHHLAVPSLLRRRKLRRDPVVDRTNDTVLQHVVHRLHHKSAAGIPNTDLTVSVALSRYSADGVNSERYSSVDGVNSERYVGNKTQPVSRQPFYKPTLEDIGKVVRLKCFPISVETESYLCMHPGEESNPVKVFHQWYKRKMIVLHKQTPNPIRILTKMILLHQQTPKQIRILTYNILAKKFVKGNRYKHCPEWAKEWYYHRELLIKELRHYNPNIVCFQEVQKCDYDSFLLPTLESHGYVGDSEMKEERRFQDGLAIFYKKNDFVHIRREKLCKEEGER